MTKCTVSIIMPCHNNGVHIEESIRSVLHQTLKDWELLIVDDASQDDSMEKVCCLAAGDSRIKLFRLGKNMGAGIARNHAIEQAQGRYLAFLDSDDVWHPRKLELQVRFMEQGNIAFSYTDFLLIDQGSNVMGLVSGLPATMTPKTIRRQNEIGCLTVMVDRASLGTLRFRPNRARQDWLLWIDLLDQVGEAKCYPSTLAAYRRTSGGVSSNKWRMAMANWKIWHYHLGFSFSKSVWYLTRYFSKSIQRHFLSRLKGKDLPTSLSQVNP